MDASSGYAELGGIAVEEPLLTEPLTLADLTAPIEEGDELLLSATQ